jgi:hypothetical protein
MYPTPAVSSQWNPNERLKVVASLEQNVDVQQLRLDCLRNTEMDPKIRTRISESRALLELVHGSPSLALEANRAQFNGHIVRFTKDETFSPSHTVDEPTDADMTEMIRKHLQA